MTGGYQGKDEGFEERWLLRSSELGRVGRGRDVRYKRLRPLPRLVLIYVYAEPRPSDQQVVLNDVSLMEMGRGR